MRRASCQLSRQFQVLTFAVPLSPTYVLDRVLAPLHVRPLCLAPWSWCQWRRLSPEQQCWCPCECSWSLPCRNCESSEPSPFHRWGWLSCCSCWIWCWRLADLWTGHRGRVDWASIRRGRCSFFYKYATFSDNSKILSLILLTSPKSIGRWKHFFRPQCLRPSLACLLSSLYDPHHVHIAVLCEIHCHRQP